MVHLLKQFNLILNQKKCEIEPRRFPEDILSIKCVAIVLAIEQCLLRMRDLCEKNCLRNYEAARLF